MIDSDRVLKSESDCEIAAGRGSPVLAAHRPALSVVRGGRREERWHGRFLSPCFGFLICKSGRSTHLVAC